MGGRFRYMFLMLAAVLVTGLTAGAAEPEVRARIEPDSISIGDHFRIILEVEKDMMQVIEFPEFEEAHVGNGIVIIDEPPLDTIQLSARQQKIRKEYLMTGFRAGYHDMGAFPVLYVDKNIVDTLYSRDTMRLLVTTFEIDTLNYTINDIKIPEETPLLVSEVKGYAVILFIIACSVAAAIYFISRSASRRNRTPEEKAKPRELPHVRAIREFEQLHNQKLWQSSKHKQYYTRLTDILRTYLDGRYGINAMEMTTDEIMAQIGNAGLRENEYDDLSALLRTADLVKFAKLVPDGDDNEKAYYKAYYFVEETKEVPDEEENKNPQQEGQSHE